MSRRITISLLTLGLLGLGFLEPYTHITAAHADGWTIDKPAIAKKHRIPTQESISALLEKGELQAAEADYIDWAKAWQEDDRDLFINIETSILQKQYKDGDKGAFIALVRAGEPSALADFTNGKVELSPEERLIALRASGAHGGLPELANCVKLLQDPDPTVVGTAIQTMGDIGTVRYLQDLYVCARTADLKNSLLIAKTMVKIGAIKQLKARYTLETHFPFENVVERAKLMLAAGGVPQNWPFLKKVLDEKPEKYYPLVLSALGNFNTDEARTYVTDALKGSEAEQLYALQSISALPEDKIDATLKGLVLKIDPDNKDSKELLLNDQVPASVRLAAIDLLAERGTEAAGDVLRKIGISLKGLDSDTIVTTILALEKGGLIGDDDLRTTLLVQLANEDPKIARAARTALLGYELNGK